MKTIKMLYAACAVVFAFTAISASAAAAHEWLLHGLPLTKSVSVKQTATYKLEDPPLGVNLECVVQEKGTVGPGAAGQITSFKTSKCYTLRGCTAETATLEAPHLPWNTEIATFEGGLGNTITTKGVEWKWGCHTNGENRTEYCTVYPTMNLKNVSEGVEEVFDARESHCLAGRIIMVGGGVLKEAEVEEKLEAK